MELLQDFFLCVHSWFSLRGRLTIHHGLCNILALVSITF
nr:MAG TPA: hypothetical protein [Caudoviricetes sp.]